MFNIPAGRFHIYLSRWWFLQLKPMQYLCTNCGHINENILCSNCGHQIDETEYEKLRDYAKRAVHYGYQYRVEYERQVSESGDVTVKYSLFQPETWYEWLAVAALSGLVGTYATDLVKFVGKQILSLLQSKIENQTLNNEEQKMVNFLSDSNQLNKFTIYIKNYYNGMPKVDKRVENAIIEEELAHMASEEMKDEFVEMLGRFDPNDTSKIGETFLKIATAAGKKRREKPSIEETRLLLKTLKKELKAEKKLKKKSKKKNKKK
jgi:DNA-directed RNA polymerase subunit RPC12/RpoP